MALKVSNETKVGALTAITITLFILGFNFLKGKSFLKRNDYYYARFQSIEGLLPSNPVVINGLTVGNVYTTTPGDEELNTVLVTIRLTEKIKVPKNSVAQIKSNPLGTPAIEITKGDSKTYLEPGDTLISVSSSGFFGSIFDKLGPTQRSIDRVLNSIDSIASKVNKTITPGVQADVQQTMVHLHEVSEKLGVTVDALNTLLNDENGSLAKTLRNLESVSSTLAANKEKISTITDNVAVATQKFRELDLQKVIDELQGTIAALKATLEKLNTTDNSMGALLNDKKMYNNLNSTLNSTNILLQDIRLHPKRYVHVSMFGKKDKSEPLMKPLAEDSVSLEQHKN